MRSFVIRVMNPTLDAVAVENPAYPGTPDVNYTKGWIELKWLRHWPARKDSVVQLEHYTQKQKLWLRRRHLAGGQVFLLLKVSREWLLFTYPNLLNVGLLAREELINSAFKYWKNGLNQEEFLKCVA